MEIKKWKSYNTKAIINNLNLVFKSKDIEKLNKPTYDFLYQLSGFIAHYDLSGFQDYYQDLRDLINDLYECSDVSRPDYYLTDFFQKDQPDYYKSKAETLKQIKPLVEKFEKEINDYFEKGERNEDIEKIKSLMKKNNLKDITILK